jgi:hypothetical protein
MTTPDLDDRLRQHHQELERLFTPLRLAERGFSRPRSRRVGLVVAFSAAALVVASLVSWQLLTNHSSAPVTSGPIKIEFAGMTITAGTPLQVTPHMSRDQALADAQAILRQLPWRLPPGGSGARVTGLTATDAKFVPDVRNIMTRCGYLVIPRPLNLWVVALSAPPQAGWFLHTGTLLINDDNGSMAGGGSGWSHDSHSQCQ